MSLRTASIAMIVLLLVWGAREVAHFSRFTPDQQLVIAAFELDVEKVEALLAAGANPDARLGIYGGELFEDKWTLSYPMGAGRWTRLLAVASSHRAPQPTERTENTSEARAAAWERLRAIDPRLIVQRDARRAAIVKLLLAVQADPDLEEGHGATALDEAVYHEYENVALLLLEAGARISAKEAVYIDGTRDITPVHRATFSPVILKAMIGRGAGIDMRDGNGETPLHWAARKSNVDSVKVLLDAGADPTVKDNDGHTPAYWAKTVESSKAPARPRRSRLPGSSKRRSRPAGSGNRDAVHYYRQTSFYMPHETITRP